MAGGVGLLHQVVYIDHRPSSLQVTSGNQRWLTCEVLPGDKQQSMETAQLQYGQASKLHKCLARTVLPHTHEDVQKQREAKKEHHHLQGPKFRHIPIRAKPWP